MLSSAQGRASNRNSYLIVTALVIIALTAFLLGRLLRRENIRQAKSVCIPLLREISLLENRRLGIRLRLFSQKIVVNKLLKKVPSIVARATRQLAEVRFLLEIYCRAQLAFLQIQGTKTCQLRCYIIIYITNLLLLIALKRYMRCFSLLIYVLIRREYVLAQTFSIIIQKLQKQQALGIYTLLKNCLTRFLLIMLLEAAKKARMQEIKKRLQLQRQSNYRGHYSN